LKENVHSLLVNEQIGVFARARVNQMVTPTEDYYSDHDGGKFAPIDATTVATWKARSFLENLTVPDSACPLDEANSDCGHSIGTRACSRRT
jgi:hypothetical protein